MTSKERLYLLEELLDVEKDSLSEDALLDDLSGWDSIAVISVIAMFDSLFGKEVSPIEVKEFKTIQDITDRME